jgi:hypothetical protein
MHEFDHKGNKGWQKARRAQDRQSREVLSITCLLSYLLKKEEIKKKKKRFLGTKWVKRWYY